LAVLVDSPVRLRLTKADGVAELGQLISYLYHNAPGFSLGLPHGSRIEAPSRVSVQRKVGVSSTTGKSFLTTEDLPPN